MLNWESIGDSQKKGLKINADLLENGHFRALHFALRSQDPKVFDENLLGGDVGHEFSSKKIIISIDAVKYFCYSCQEASFFLMS